jgi:hypothetical protein
LSRSLRFYLLATMIFLYGATIRAFIEKYFNYLTLAFMVMLVGGFLLFAHAA